MKPLDVIRDELIHHAKQYPGDAAQQCTEYVAERTQRIEAVLTVAEVENRQLLASEQRTVTKLTDEVETLKRLETTLNAKAVEARQVELDEHRDRVELASARARNYHPSTNSTPARDAALRHAESRQVNVDDSVREAIVRCVDAAHQRGADGAAVIDVLAHSADPDYLHAFTKLLRHGETAAPLLWTPTERDAFQKVTAFHQQRTALQSGTATGNYLTPAALDPTVLITGTGGSANSIRRVARVVQVAAPVWKGVTAGQVSASYDSELTEVSDDTPTLAQPTATLIRGQAFVQYSAEFAMDTEGWAAEVGRLMADARDVLEASKLAYDGDGVTAPQGFWTSITSVTASRVNATTAATFGLVDCFKLQNALPPRHSAKAAWFASLTVINLIRQACLSVSSASGMWSDVAGAPSMFLGRPIYEVPTAPVTTTAGDFPLVYADPSTFVICDHIGSTVELVPQLFGGNGRPTGSRGLYAMWRTGSVQTSANAGRALKC